MHSDILRADVSSREGQAAPILGRAVAERGVLRQASAEGARALSVLSLPVLVGGRRLGTVAIAYDQGTVRRLLAKVQRESLLRFLQVTLAGIGLSLLLALVLARTLTRPIRQLSIGAEMIGRGKLDYRIPEAGSDELGRLAGQFNSMARKLSELDELKESFLTQITHDLRNPLGAVMGFAEILQTGMHGPLNAAQEKSIGIILTNSQYLSELINNILDLTKFEAGRMELNRRPLALRACVQPAVELLEVKAREFGVRLEYSQIPESAVVLADEQGLRRVLHNLISNALKFTPQGGQVSILWACAKDGQDCIAVKDTGIGIPADKLNSLFGKFCQIAETKNKVRESRGTGLGLVICKGIVEAHGGRIGVESEYKKGTTFYFTLPPAPRTSAADVRSS
ncbi:MAG: HAMP domain-containing sensor histidine kinase [Elusimicrobiota bacterium]